MGSKRKASEQSSGVSISIDSSKAKVQPVLATFSAAVPPVAAAFTTYRGMGKSRSDDYIVASETEKIEFVGQTFDGAKPLVDGCRYLIGVYDQKNDTVTFRRAPYVRVNSVIKSLKGARGVADRDIANRLLQARNELGEAFGSKKKKAQIRAEERNRINMDGVRNDMKVIGASIELRASSMPTAQDLKDAENVNRPVPKYNPEATVVAEIYDLEDVLPKSVAGHINVASLVKNMDADVYKANVPSRSMFVKKKLDHILAQTKPDAAQLRCVLYLAYMMRLSTLNNKHLANRDTCVKTLCCSPEVADALFDKFAECVAGTVNPDGSPVYKMTPATENKLVCYISVLMLSLNNWVLYPAELAGDLGIPGKKAEKFLAGVGCKLEVVSAAEVAAQTMNKRTASRSGKKAVLQAPIKFPKASLRGGSN
ncbi:DNA-directed RNA polymerase I subunit rpa49 [Coemansia erecta]|nr:DNA-directed RNA polymerase I subunit rpa49 [Coemansia sp. RSA 2618]KAJ2819704.1 DNA-directed RNA polymerase I subunit rpa49 [Coemansia erecta]